MATSNDTATSIGGMDDTIPVDATSGGRSRGGAEIRKVKNLLVTDFPSITGPVTATHTELNVVDGVTAGTVTASKALVVDASKDLATLNSLDATTLKQGGTAISSTFAPLASPTFTGTVTTPLTASKAVVTGSSSELASSAVTATELGYVAGVTSAIQTQIDAKEDTISLTAGHAVQVSGSGTLEASTVTTPELAVLSGVNAFNDEDDMVSNSPTAIASQQSIKAYVDAQIAGVAAVKSIQTGYIDINSTAWTTGTNEDASYYDVTGLNAVTVANCVVHLQGIAAVSSNAASWETARMVDTTTLRISYPYSSPPAAKLRYYIVEYN